MARPVDPDPPARRKLMRAAIRLMLARGYSAVSVDDICTAAEVSKGSFFHYFATKEELAAATLDAYMERVFAFFAEARAKSDEPLERFRACMEALAAASESGPVRYGCLLGGFSLDLSATHPAIRDLCSGYFERWIALLAGDLQEAAAARGTTIDARAVAEHAVVAFEGAVVLTKASGDSGMVRRAMEHIIDYVEVVLRK